MLEKKASERAKYAGFRFLAVDAKWRAERDYTCTQPLYSTEV